MKKIARLLALALMVTATAAALTACELDIDDHAPIGHIK